MPDEIEAAEQEELALSVGSGEATPTLWVLNRWLGGGAPALLAQASRATPCDT